MSWFHSNISAKEAHELLQKKGADGSFLVRHSEDNCKNYALTFRRDDIIEEITIENKGDFFKFKGDQNKLQSSTLFELVNLLRKNHSAQVKDDIPVILKEPMIDTTFIKDNYGWYHNNIRISEAESILLDCGEEGCFLVRPSMHSPGSFVLCVLQNNKVTHFPILSDSNGVQVKGSSHYFDSLSKLVGHYQNNPTKTTKTIAAIKLTKCVGTTRFNVAEISQRMKELGGLTSEDEDSAAEGYQKEFDDLQKVEDETVSCEPNQCSIGARPENKTRNRFKNILPFDKTRVKLMDNPGTGANDYINANYIQSEHQLTNSTRYIATQGPLKGTVTDFWRMIVQEKVSIIVMTTKEVEGGKNKCVRYWPTSEEESKDFEVHNCVLRISHVSEHTYSDYVLRELQVTKWIESNDEEEEEMVQFGEAHKIFHFHYTGWPDHGVPNLKGILSFILNINQYHQKFLGYLLVHCSAGIGRTGTIIIIDILINEIKHKGLNCKIDIFETIRLLRKQRSGMVQTETQYQFIYQAIHQYVQEFGKTSTSISNQMMEDHIYNN